MQTLSQDFSVIHRHTWLFKLNKKNLMISTKPPKYERRMKISGKNETVDINQLLFYYKPHFVICVSFVLVSLDVHTHLCCGKALVHQLALQEFEIMRHNTSSPQPTIHIHLIRVFFSSCFIRRDMCSIYWPTKKTTNRDKFKTNMWSSIFYCYSYCN